MQACVDREADLRVRMGLILQHRDLGGEGRTLDVVATLAAEGAGERLLTVGAVRSAMEVAKTTSTQ